MVRRRGHKLKMKRLKRHPAAIDLDKWLKNGEGMNATDPMTLGVAPTFQQYLENRIKRAFNAGWCAGEIHGCVKPPNDPSSATGESRR